MPGFRVGKPRGRARLSADVLLAAGFATIPLDLIDFDEPVAWDGAGNYTIGKTGLWLVSWQLQRRSTATSSQITTRIQRNGVFLAGGQGPGTGQDHTVPFTQLFELVLGDVLAFQGRGHSILPWSAGSTQTAASITRVGPERWT